MSPFQHGRNGLVTSRLLLNRALTLCTAGINRMEAGVIPRNDRLCSPATRADPSLGGTHLIRDHTNLIGDHVILIIYRNNLIS